MGWRFGAADAVRSHQEWSCATRPRAFNPALRESPDPTPAPIGLLAAIEGPRVEVRTANGSFAFQATDIPAAGARHFLDGQVSVERVPAVELHAAPETEDDYPELAREPSGGGIWLAWQSYRNESDAVLARRFDGRQWGAPMTVLERGDVYRTAIAAAGNETWVVWSQQVGGNWDLYGRAYRSGAWGPVARLTDAPQPDIHHRLERDAAGNLWLAWQGARHNQFDILVRRYDGRSWGPEQNLSNTPQNDWEPAIAAGAKGGLWVAWDGYEAGNYDVYLSGLQAGGWTKPPPPRISKPTRLWRSMVRAGSGRPGTRVAATGAKTPDSRSAAEESPARVFTRTAGCGWRGWRAIAGCSLPRCRRLPIFATGPALSPTKRVGSGFPIASGTGSASE
jgi:hypothetical protein